MAGLVAAAAVAESAWAGCGQATELSDAALMAANDALGALRRRVDAAHAQVAAQIAARSRRGAGPDSLVRKNGYRTPAELISATTGATTGDAVKLVRVGEATAPREVFDQTASPKHPHVAVAVAADRLSVAAADAIVRMLDGLPASVGRHRIDAAEARLVQLLAGLPADRWHRILTAAEADLDPDGLTRRESEAYQKRYLRIWERAGLVHFDAAVPAGQAAPVVTVLDALVTAGYRAGAEGSGRSDAVGDREDDGVGMGDRAGDCRDAMAGGPDDGTPISRDGEGVSDTAESDVIPQRTLAQRRVDALVMLAEHYLGCGSTDQPLGGATVVVRVDLQTLQDGVGTATIDGLDQPVSAGEARRIAASAGTVVPMVLGGAGEVLDLGRAQRLFTPAQKLVLYERDGGCAFCGAPPGQTRAHHMFWWARDGGPTDLANGVLLCEACHHRIHDNGWGIRIERAAGARRDRATTGRRARVWFIPPPDVDPDRTPRPGGRARHEYAA